MNPTYTHTRTHAHTYLGEIGSAVFGVMMCARERAQAFAPFGRAGSGLLCGRMATTALTSDLVGLGCFL